MAVSCWLLAIGCLLVNEKQLNETTKRIRTMTGVGLENLKGLATEIDELREQAEKKLARLLNLYQYEEDINAREAHSMLIKASESMKDVTWNLGRAVTQIQSAYKYETELNAFYDGLLNKLHNDNR